MRWCKKSLDEIALSPGSVLHLWLAGGRGRDLGGRLLLLLQLLGRRVRVGLAALVGGAGSHAQQVRGNAPALSARYPSAALRTRPAEVPLVTLVRGQCVTTARTTQRDRALLAFSIVQPEQSRMLLMRFLVFDQPLF